MNDSKIIKDIRYVMRQSKKRIILFLFFIGHKYNHIKIVQLPYLYFAKKLILKSNLFDRDFYLTENADVSEKTINPLKHFILFGDKEGRKSSALFDPKYYKSHAKKTAKGQNALVHYLVYGRFQRFSTSPWFDVDYYLTQNKDVLRSGIEPIKHYLKFGYKEKRSPSSDFDVINYFSHYPELLELDINPLIHYLNEGRYHIGQIDQTSTEKDMSFDWNALVPFTPEKKPKIDVIIPVYKGKYLTLKAIYSVLKNKQQTSYELIVINDASPEADLVKVLEQLAQCGYFKLIHNKDNLGFVQTVNKGMALHPDRDVVLLNSDAEVYNDWLDRLVQQVNAQEQIASVTPFSNNATICSYPRFNYDNPYPLELSFENLDVLASKVNRLESVSAPTGVGFCMYMTRSSIDKVGFFDAKTFGKGYGEENDWCQRAIKKGWHNLIAADVFVRHYGSASFQGEKHSRVVAAMKLIDNLYPEYHKTVQAFVKDDPLRTYRENLDLGRLVLSCKESNVLIVSHGRGGGTEKHIQEETAVYLQKGYGVFYLRPLKNKSNEVFVTDQSSRKMCNLSSISLDNTEALSTVLKKLKISVIHSHGLVDFTSEAPYKLLKLSEEMDVPLDVDIHDYKVICPRINLIDKNSIYCGEPTESQCNNCLAQNGNDFGVTDIKTWRASHYEVLKNVRNVCVPDPDVSNRLQKYYPDVHFEILPHDEIKTEFTGFKLKNDSQLNETLRIVVIGAISKIKGFNQLVNCAADVKKRELPIQFVLMGFSLNDRVLEKAGVEVVGKYEESEASQILKDIKPHAVWLPSTWPETYSYTLSIALQNSLPVFAFDIGAIASRLREVNQSEGLMPFSYIYEPKKINQFFLDLKNHPVLKGANSEELNQEN